MLCKNFNNELFIQTVQTQYNVSDVKAISTLEPYPGEVVIFFEAFYQEEKWQLVAKSFESSFSCVDEDILKETVKAMRHTINMEIYGPEPLSLRNGSYVYVCESVRSPNAGNPVAGDCVDSVTSHSSAKRRKHVQLTFMYLMTRLPGKPFSEIENRNSSMRYCLGYAAGILCKGFESFQSLVIKKQRGFYDLQYFMDLQRYLKQCSDQKLRKQMMAVFKRFDSSVVPHIPVLRTGVRHNDLNPQNLICKSEFTERTSGEIKREHLRDFTAKMCGFVDYDDIAYGPYMFDLAITIIHELMEDFECSRKLMTSIALPIIEGFFDAFPITSDKLELELSLLYPVMSARLVQIYLGLLVTIGNTSDNEKYKMEAEKMCHFMPVFFKEGNADFCEMLYASLK